MSFYDNTPGDDVMSGSGFLVDFAEYSNAKTPVRVDLAIKGPQDTGQGRDTLISIEGIFGSASADILSGDAGRNEIHGHAGDDVIDGRGGVDVLHGDEGNDVVHGGDGDDSLQGQAGDDALYGDGGNDWLLGGTYWTLDGDGIDTLHGGDGMDTLTGGGGDFLYGDADNDLFYPSTGLVTIDGGTGSDTIYLANLGGGVTLDLSLTAAQTVRTDVQVKLTSVENAVGGDDADRLTGNADANTFTGRGGDDVLDGGAGGDTVVMSNASIFYSVTRSGNDWKVADLRAGAPDGVDTLRNIEFIRFTDALVPIGDGLSLMVTNLLRLTSTAAANLVTDLEGRVSVGVLDRTKVYAEVAGKAAATTTIAALAYEFFTGKIPTQGGFDYLVSPTGGNANNLNSAYYAQFDTVNRYINFSVNLGKNGEGKGAFAAAYGSLSLFDATKKAYAAIFGGTPTDAKVHSLIDARVDYLASYGGDGAAGIGTKAAMVGFLLAAAATEHVGVMAKSADAWLMDLADGAAPFAVDVLDTAKGYYDYGFIFAG